MNNAKYLIEFKDINNFLETYSSIISYDWKIRKGSLQQRNFLLSQYANNKIKLNTEFKKNFNYKIENGEVIGYSDVLSLIKRLIDQHLEKENLEMKFFMEYLIPYANSKRIDFLITFKNTVLLLEFSYFDEEKSEKTFMETYHTKLTQVMQYETLLKNLISNKIKTVPYVILYSPEYEKDQEIEKNIEINNLNIRNLAELIIKLYNNDKNAYEEIKALD